MNRTPRTTDARPHSEGYMAGMIEDQTAKLPSDTFLYVAAIAIAGAMYLQMHGRKPESLFIGQWVAPILILGLYNKLVKVAGSDRT